MSEFKETVTVSDNQGVNEHGSQVRQQTKRIDTSESTDGKSVITNVIWFIVGAISVLLAFRFVLKLLGANPSSGFVEFIYNVSGVFTAPFDNIFGVTTTNTDTIRSVFEPSILVAAAVYALIGWGLVKLLNVDHDA